MKKVVRTVWIAALSGLAFLSACCTPKGTSRAERRQLTKERDALQKTLSEREDKSLDVLNANDFMTYQKETYDLQNHLDSINYRLGEDVDLDRNVRRRELLFRLDSLNAAMKRLESALVYGPPTDMGETNPITLERRKLKTEIREAEKALEAFDQVKPDERQPIELLYGPINVIKNDPQPVLIIKENEEEK